MRGDPDDTVLIPRPGARRGGVARGLAAWVVVGVVAGVAVLAVAGGGAWYAFRGAPPIAPPSAAPPVVVVVPAPFVAAPPALPGLAGEAEILDRAPVAVEAYRFALQPEIVVLQFATLAEQADALNRAAALIEKAGFPRDRVVDRGEMDRRIRAAGATPETFYYGHDYRGADLLRFFAEAERAGDALTPGEAWLRQQIREWGWRPGGNAALISLVRDDPVSGLDRLARATILRHELSHGYYFVNAEYAAYSLRFWQESLTASERDRFRAFLALEGYDTGIEDLVVNETQAYLMHTASERFFSARAVGLTVARLDVLRGLFLTGMPPGWLRDCTTLPAAGSPAPRPRRRLPKRRVGQRLGRVRTTMTAAEMRAPLRAA